MSTKIILPFLALLAAVALSAQVSSVSVSVSPNPARFGSPITLSATVFPASATGKVTFYGGTRVLGTAIVSNGVATLVSTQFNVAANAVTVRYDGDLNNLPAGSVPVIVTVNAVAGGGFPQLTSYGAGQNPSGVATGDFNGDGKLDLAVVSATSQLVYIFLGNGTGTFQSPTAFAAGSLPVAVTVADLNGDGRADLIIANDYNGNVVPAVSASIDVLLGYGNGTFQAPVAYVSLNAPLALATGDFNGDGNVDVAVANASYGDVNILLGQGNGTLSAGVELSTGSTLGATALAIGDFNGDGVADIAIAEQNIFIALGNGDGTFTIGQPIAAGSNLNDVQAADFNRDGILDLAVADYGSASVSVLLGFGNGTFQAAMPYPVQTAPSAMVITDFNGDGKLDIVAANNFSGGPGTVSVLAGSGTGTFTAAGSFSAGVGPFRIVQGDFNGDGVPDLAVDDLGSFGTDAGGVAILPGGCYTVTPSTPLFFDNSGTNGAPVVFTLNALNQACSWNASSTIPGVTFSPASGTGNGVVTVTLAPNISGADLTGTLSITGATINVFEAFTAQQFMDVPPSAYYFDAINLLKTLNVTTGCTPTMYCPTTPISRAQMAIFIVRSIFGGDTFPVNLTPQQFTDVAPTDFGYKWIQKMAQLQITTGCTPTLFCPNDDVSRDQMAIFIIRARYGASTAFTYNPAAFFLDVPAGAFGFQWIQRMKQDGITNGCAPVDYCPANPVTRGDMAIFIDRGSFNLILPPTEPLITQVTPATLAPGTSVLFTVMGVNTFFTQALPVFVAPTLSGLTASGVTVLSDTAFTITLTAAPDALVQPEPMYVRSTVEAVKPNAISVTP